LSVLIYEPVAANLFRNYHCFLYTHTLVNE
jgi:hypothetical protein